VNLDVAVNGRSWKVAIEAGTQSGDFTVSVKGKTRVVNASWIDPDTLSLIDGSSAREVRIHRREGGVMSIALDGRVFEAVVSAGQEARLKPRPSAVGRDFSHADERHAVKAPMPGRIVRVLVAVGDRVAAGQAVVIVEAMKMENELRSTKDGVVKEVNVRQGAAIDASTVLVVIE